MDTEAEIVTKLRENRSFMIRQVRMSPHQKAAYEHLSTRYGIAFDESSIADNFDWDIAFGRRGARRVVDIGFGMGQALVELAVRNPDTDFLGVEVHKPGIGRVLGQLEERGIQNVRVVRYDAVVVCHRLIPKNSIDGLHLFFPDPWPKKRHHKRRLVRPGFPELIAPLLKPGGYFYAVTDWEEYAYVMLEVLDHTAGLVNSSGEGFSPSQEWRPETAFERKGRQKGHNIFEVLYHREVPQDSAYAP
ncbi:MAG TPA: tRNA (guanosine(46)-N7)-methyltransferase TrmB [Alkalispirochaeta sp.]|nr:tRNA (guanosine(46)-N7)-methyltransferase TrmB [Alkalispirochaeta sp.]